MHLPWRLEALICPDSQSQSLRLGALQYPCQATVAICPGAAVPTHTLGHPRPRRGHLGLGAAGADRRGRASPAVRSRRAARRGQMVRPKRARKTHSATNLRKRARPRMVQRGRSSCWCWTMRAVGWSVGRQQRQQTLEHRSARRGNSILQHTLAPPSGINVQVELGSRVNKI